MTFSSLRAQAPTDVYHVDRTAEKRICHLPLLYFLPNSAELDPDYLSDLAFIAYYLKKNRRLKLRLRPEIAPHPDDPARKLLTEERLSYLIWLLEDRYKIPPKRIIRDEYAQLSRNYRGNPPAIPVTKRRILCECEWKK
ncbi:MAG: hypothetical protein AAFR61_10650 [Bacteroidota bacterium]